MRTSFRILTAAAATSIGFLAFAATPAMASPAAPLCDSSTGQVECDILGGTAPYTWTITDHIDGTSTTFSYTTPSDGTSFGCEHGEIFNIHYSYVSGGVTETSLPTTVVCSTGKPE
jgi:hypothetical protein